MRKEIEKLMEENKVPGLSMAFIKNAEIQWCRNFGLKRLGTNDFVDEDAVFEAASLSKPVFAYGVLQLVESGKLNLDTPLSEYLASYEIENDERFNLITARMVLSHTTGFPNWRREEGKLKIHFHPGERFSYSGEGFVYLQKVLEKLSGLSLEEYAVKHIFGPIKMTHSSFVWQKEYETLKALGHDLEGRVQETPKRSVGNAAFTLHTRALDYALFVIAMMKEVDSNSPFSQLFKSQISVEKGRIECIDKSSGILSESVSWGLGWGLQQTQDGTSFWHWGDNNNFKCYVVGFKNENKGLVIFTNSENGFLIIPEIIYKIIDVHQPAFEWVLKAN